MMSSFFSHSGVPEGSLRLRTLGEQLRLLQIALQEVGLRDHGVGLGSLALLVVAVGQKAIGARILVVNQRLAQETDRLRDARLALILLQGVGELHANEARVGVELQRLA